MHGVETHRLVESIVPALLREMPEAEPASHILGAMSSRFRERMSDARLPR